MPWYKTLNRKVIMLCRQLGSTKLTISFTMTMFPASLLISSQFLCIQEEFLQEFLLYYSSSSVARLQQNGLSRYRQMPWASRFDQLTTSLLQFVHQQAKSRLKQNSLVIFKSSYFSSIRTLLMLTLVSGSFSMLVLPGLQQTLFLLFSPT